MPSFKYYIHDSTGQFRLELLGELTETGVADLTGCWHTAKSTVADRKLVLDLRGLKAVDEAGRQWLASMSMEGASYLPDSFFESCLAAHSGNSEGPAPARNNGFLRKLVSFFRGLRVTPESSTPAQ
jgi:hypothetical protein